MNNTLLQASKFKVNAVTDALLLLSQLVCHSGKGNYSAKRFYADYVVTRNSKDFEENDVEVISAEEACKLLEDKKQADREGIACTR